MFKTAIYLYLPSSAFDYYLRSNMKYTLKQIILWTLAVLIFMLILFFLMALFFFIPFDEVLEGPKIEEKIVVAMITITLIMVEVFLLKYLLRPSYKK